MRVRNFVVYCVIVTSSVLTFEGRSQEKRLNTNEVTFDYYLPYVTQEEDRAAIYSLSLDRQLLQTDWLGANLQQTHKTVRQQLSLPDDQGIVVVNLEESGPAATAGLKENDILLTLAGHPVASPDNVTKVLLTWRKENPAEDTPLDVQFIRAGQKVNVQLTPSAAYSVDALSHVYLSPGVQDDKFRIGVSVADVDGTLRAHLSIPEGQGLVVTEVHVGQAADTAGLKAHDILLEYDGKPLGSTEELRERVQSVGTEGKSATMKLIRGGNIATIPIKPAKPPIVHTLTHPILLDALTSADLYDTFTIPHADVTSVEPQATQLEALTKAIKELTDKIAAIEAKLND